MFNQTPNSMRFSCLATSTIWTRSIKNWKIGTQRLLVSYQRSTITFKNQEWTRADQFKLTKAIPGSRNDDHDVDPRLAMMTLLLETHPSLIAVNPTTMLHQTSLVFINACFLVEIPLIESQYQRSPEVWTCCSGHNYVLKGSWGFPDV